MDEFGAINAGFTTNGRKHRRHFFSGNLESIKEDKNEQNTTREIL